MGGSSPPLATPLPIYWENGTWGPCGRGPMTAGPSIMSPEIFNHALVGKTYLHRGPTSHLSFRKEIWCQFSAQRHPGNPDGEKCTEEFRGRHCHCTTPARRAAAALVDHAAGSKNAGWGQKRSVRALKEDIILFTVATCKNPKQICKEGFNNNCNLCAVKLITGSWNVILVRIEMAPPVSKACIRKKKLRKCNTSAYIIIRPNNYATCQQNNIPLHSGKLVLTKSV